MSGGTKLTLKERLEAVWQKRRPDPETRRELSADGMETRTPSEAEFMGNLEKVVGRPKPEKD